MRKLLSFLLAAILATTIGCEDDPNYPIVPYIEFDELRFEATPDPSEPDELILTIKFRDGDNDLGVDFNDFSEQYNPAFFFLAKDEHLQAVSTSYLITNEKPLEVIGPIISPAEGQSGKLATLKTRSVPGYEFMPENTFPFSCLNYINYPLGDPVYIEMTDLWMIDESYNIVDTIKTVTPALVVVAEKFYFESNENQFNIFVDFLVEQPDGSFQKFDWRTMYCTTFDGRFPNTSKLGTKTFRQGPFSVKKSSRWEGRITYSMKSSGFPNIFGGKRLKLRVHVKDRALHSSNIVETNIFQF